MIFLSLRGQKSKERKGKKKKIMASPEILQPMISYKSAYYEVKSYFLNSADSQI